MSNAVYQQFPLPPKHQIIRLLRLDECIYDSPDDEALPTALHCSFEVHDLGSAPEFVALSYAWGADTLGDEFLTIDGHAWPTRQNLRDAMLHIWDERAWERKGAWHTTRQKEAWEDFKDMPYSISRPVMLGFETRDRLEKNVRPLIWIDYLCIDQDNVDERNHQVNLMRVIYSKAKWVVIWLGLPADDSELVVEYVRTIGVFLDRSDSDAFADSWRQFLKHEANWQAVQALTKRPYWSRLWVVQEVMLAKRMLMCLGQDSLMVNAQESWSDLSHTIHQGPLGVQLPSLFSHIFGGAYLFRRLQVTPLSGLDDLIDTWGDQQCHDPRDKIYGLLGLTDGSSAWPEADYSLSAEQLYTKVVVSFAEASYDSLQFFLRFATKLKRILHVDINNSLVIEADTHMKFVAGTFYKSQGRYFERGSLLDAG